MKLNLLSLNGLTVQPIELIVMFYISLSIAILIESINMFISTFKAITKVPTYQFHYQLPTSSYHHLSLELLSQSLMDNPTSTYNSLKSIHYTATCVFLKVIRYCHSLLIGFTKTIMNTDRVQHKIRNGGKYTIY